MLIYIYRKRTQENSCYFDEELPSKNNNNNKEIENNKIIIYRAMRAKTILYLIVFTIYIVIMINKPQNIEYLSIRSISTKYIKNWF